jgi:HEAT repeat protein
LYVGIGLILSEINSMSLRKRVLGAGLFAVLAAAVMAEGVKSDWNDFLHYTAIGRFDLAKGYAEKLVAAEPNAVELLALSEQNPDGYNILLKMNIESPELREVSGKILEIIEQGRFIRKTDPKIIVEEIRRLSTTIRGRIAAESRLNNAGEYAIPFMLMALGDESRKNEYSSITQALPKIGRNAIRPLVAAMQTDRAEIKAEIIRALGEIGYFEPLPYLKLVMEKDSSPELKALAEMAITKIDSNALKIPAAELFFQLAEKYYNRDGSVAVNEEYSFGNIWFADPNTAGPVRQEVDKKYFNELMAMRCCEWALKADPSAGKAIGLWLAAFYRAESYGIPMPAYFGAGHADAMTYATTAGPEYLHQALDRALKNKENVVALGVVEALAVNAGTKSLLYQLGTEQPLAAALTCDDRKVRTVAAIAIAQALPTSGFVGSEKIIENLSEAILEKESDQIGQELAAHYALRAIGAMRQLALTRNTIVDLSKGLDAMIEVTESGRPQMQELAAETLARLESSQAQRAIAQMALNDKNADALRIAAFGSLAISAKQNGNLLSPEQIDAIYAMVSSTQTVPQLRAVAAGAFGALNLPSEKVKDLILDQTKS